MRFVVNIPDVFVKRGSASLEKGNTMTLKTQKIASQHMWRLAFVALLGISGGAQALCLNADGSLDDSSMNTASIDRSLLPACNVQTKAPAQVSEPRESAAKPADETPNRLKRPRTTPSKVATAEEVIAPSSEIGAKKG